MNFQFQLVSSVFFSLFLINRSDGANILFYNLVSSYSHRIAVWPLVEALAARGHNVTFHQSYPPKTPNPKVREFYPKSLGHIWEYEKEDGTKSTEDRFLPMRIAKGSFAIQKFIWTFPFFALHICEQLLSNAEFQEFLNSNTFDLVIIDALFNDCAYGLAQKWGAKTILYESSAPSGVWGTEALGFLGTTEPWIADQVIPSKMPMSFLDRVKNGLIITAMHLLKEWIYYPRLANLFETKLNISNMPSVPEMIRETSLVFYNSHFSEEEARSLPPMFVSVPAMHVWKTNSAPLPKDMADFIEASGENGFIYMSFGGEADITTTPQEFQNIFLNAFAKSNVRFLWKRSGERPMGMSDNVFMKDWMPQKDILASPKCRGFITHGGLLGMQEAIMAGVPMIAMPIFAEQEFNAYRLERTGRGIKLEVQTLTEKELMDAIVEILTNKSYKKNVEKVGKQLRDQQNSPIDTAVFWTEYVLRNNDMSTLRPMVRKELSWYQIYFFDVWAFLGLVVTTFIFIFIYILKSLLKCWNTKSRSIQKVKKN